VVYINFNTTDAVIQTYPEIGAPMRDNRL